MTEQHDLRHKSPMRIMRNACEDRHTALNYWADERMHRELASHVVVVGPGTLQGSERANPIEF